MDLSDDEGEEFGFAAPHIDDGLGQDIIDVDGEQIENFDQQENQQPNPNPILNQGQETVFPLQLFANVGDIDLIPVVGG